MFSFCVRVWVRVHIEKLLFAILFHFEIFNQFNQFNQRLSNTKMKPNSTNLLPSDRLAATPPSVTLSLVTTALGAAFQSIQNDGLSVDQSQSDQPVQAHQNLTHLHVPTNLSYFEAFTSYYSEVHGWISLTVCIFGIIANIVNIIVLTR